MKTIMTPNGLIQEPLTQAEIDKLEAEKIEIEQLVQAKLQAEETAKQARVTGNQKLLDLGLTQAEATALTGYTPPVAE